MQSGEIGSIQILQKGQVGWAPEGVPVTAHGYFPYARSEGLLQADFYLPNAPQVAPADPNQPLSTTGTGKIATRIVTEIELTRPKRQMQVVPTQDLPKIWQRYRILRHHRSLPSCQAGAAHLVAQGKTPIQNGLTQTHGNRAVPDIIERIPEKIAQGDIHPGWAAGKDRTIGVNLAPDKRLDTHQFLMGFDRHTACWCSQNKNLFSRKKPPCDKHMEAFLWCWFPAEQCVCTDQGSHPSELLGSGLLFGHGIGSGFGSFSSFVGNGFSSFVDHGFSGLGSFFNSLIHSRSNFLGLLNGSGSFFFFLTGNRHTSHKKDAKKHNNFLHHDKSPKPRECCT
jgi:hypothetical protein